VKRYVEEPGSEAVRALLAEGPPSAARFSEVEISSALARRCREGAFPAAERDRAITQLREDFRSLSLVETTAGVVGKGVSLLCRHRLRAADALQLAACLELREHLGLPVRFVAYDERLLGAARSEGLATAP
jgi:predicted nucleic acid-binding protein